jgi:putative ABC transport system permease protein
MPDWKAEVQARLASLNLSPTREAEIVDELSQDLDDRYRESIAAGASPEEATDLALAGFQNRNVLIQQMALLRQSHAAAPITPAAPTGWVFSDVWQDLVYATRVFRKQPGFAATAVLTLALGIGATTAIFSVVYGVLLKPLPFHDPGRLVSLLHRGPGANLETMNQGPATYLTYRDNQQTFEAIGGWDANQVSVTGRGDPEQVEALSVTETTLSLLGVQPHLGRLFTAEDTAPGRPLQTVLTYGYWQRRFGGAENIIGQSLEIDGAACVIIGVLPSSFKFLRNDPVLLLPMQVDAATAFRGISFDRQALARLKPGVSIEQASADIARMISLLPPSYEVLKLEPKLRSLADDVVGDVANILWMLLAAVGAVLLIACGNVANLFLIRAEGRQQELAMRAALGASRGRLARVLLSESVLLALAGGAVGLALAEAALGVLTRVAPAELPRVNEISIDLMVLLFTILISVLSGTLFGLLAAARCGAPRVVATIKEGGRSSSDGPARHRARNVLVVSQVALALTLLVVSGLMIRTFVAMRQVAPGFTRPEDVQTFRVAIPRRLFTDEEQIARAYHSIAERLSQVPGAVSVGLTSSITMDGEDNANPLFVEEFPLAEGALPPLRRYKAVGPGYFETMGNGVIAGRSITWAEIFERRPLVVVSATIAREYWDEPSRALGKRVRGGSKGEWHEIVGVVGDERDDGLNHPPTAIVYWPMLSSSYGQRTMAYAVRSNRVGAPGFMREIQQAVWSVNPTLPVAAVHTLDEIQARSMAQTSFAMAMLAIAATVALLLGVVGIYGVVAYVATQRTREIGIRMALGAQIGDVRAMFLRHGLWLMATGIALGVVVALVLTRVMSALLFGVGPMDPMTYASVSAALAAVGLLATYLPARRASRVDPVVALRADV